MVDDAQTHRLPADREGIARLAIFLGYRGPDGFVADLTAHLSSVERHYAELFEEAPSLAGPGNLVFTGTEDDPETLAHPGRARLCRSARRSPRWCAAGITAGCARRAASGRARS